MTPDPFSLSLKFNGTFVKVPKYDFLNMVNGVWGQTHRYMKKIDLTWMTQISFGSTIIFPNSVVIKISPCWGTREENRTKRKENLRENKDWGLSYHCSCDRRQWKHQQPFSSPIRKSPSELLKHLEREEKKNPKKQRQLGNERQSVTKDSVAVWYVKMHLFVTWWDTFAHKYIHTCQPWRCCRCTCGCRCRCETWRLQHHRQCAGPATYKIPISKPRIFNWKIKQKTASSTHSHKVHFLLRRFGDGERQPSQLWEKTQHQKLLCTI